MTKKIFLLTVILSAMCSSCYSQERNESGLINEEIFELSRIDYKDIIVEKTLPYKKSLYTQSYVLRKAYYDKQSDMFFRNLDYYFGISCLLSLETYLDVKKLRDDFLKNDIQLFITSISKETVEIKEKSNYYFRVSIVPKTNIEEIFNIYRIESNDSSQKTIDIYNFYLSLEKKYNITFIGIGDRWLTLIINNKAEFKDIVNDVQSYSKLMNTYEYDYLLKRFEKDGIIDILF